MMRSSTASVWETSTACEALTSVTWPLASVKVRCAMNALFAVPRALSRVATRDQLGIVFHVAAAEVSLKACRVNGRWVATIRRCVAGGTSDDRGAPQHAVRRVGRAARPVARRHGRGPLPRRPVPRRGLGGGDHPPAGRRRRLVSLSATVSNAEEFADWLVTVRGDTEVVVEEHRPVPLWQHVLVGTRLYDLFVETRQATRTVNPDLRPVGARGDPAGRRGTGRADRSGARSRAGPRSSSGSTARACCPRSPSSSAGPAATPPSSSACAPGCGSTPTRSARVRTSTSSGAPPTIPREDLRVLGYWEWLDGLERGIAAHHAGMLPTFKEVVEELFVAGLVKAVFATETLALGINMPARSVVLEKLVKWNGEAHVDVTPGSTPS